MPIHEYHNFSLMADQVVSNDGGIREFVIQVFSSPAGEGKPIVCAVPEHLQQELNQLEQRTFQMKDVIRLGEMLADLLLPKQARELFMRSFDKLKPDEGLRIRLRLASSLADIPWEYMYIQREDGEKDASGFLALDPRISIVRHEPLPLAADLAEMPKPLRLLVALASPHDLAPLNLTQERTNMQKALQALPGVVPDFLENATVEAFNDKLLTGATIFHFAGHGFFGPAAVSANAQSGIGGGIVLTTQDGKAVFMPADQLAINLRSRGVQLVVLGACETGRRDGLNIWNGVASALMAAGIPTAIAMQYTIWDDSAVVFSRNFYQALAAGLLLDEAVATGRLAAFNLCHALRDDPHYSKFWQDWGVPVLYLRASQDFVLPVTAKATSASTQHAAPDECTFLEAELAQHRRNLGRLRQQKAIYAEGEAPLRLLNQIEAEEQSIRELEDRLTE